MGAKARKKVALIPPISDYPNTKVLRMHMPPLLLRSILRWRYLCFLGRLYQGAGSRFSEWNEHRFVVPRKWKERTMSTESKKH